MKNKKVIFIGAAVLLVVLVAVLVICLLVGDKKKEDEKVLNPYEGLGEIEYIEYIYNGDPVTLVKKDGKWIWKDDKDLQVDQDAVEAVISGISDFTIIDFIEEPSSLKEYGLKEPTYSITMKDAKGHKKIIYIGDSMGEDGMSWYVMEKGTDIVYVAGYEIIDCIDSLDIQRNMSIQMQEIGETFTEE